MEDEIAHPTFSTYQIPSLPKFNRYTLVTTILQIYFDRYTNDAFIKKILSPMFESGDVLMIYLSDLTFGGRLCVLHLNHGKLVYRFSIYIKTELRSVTFAF